MVDLSRLARARQVRQRRFTRWESEVITCLEPLRQEARLRRVVGLHCLRLLLIHYCVW